MSTIPQPTTTASRPAERPPRHPVDALSPTYPSAATNVPRAHPSSKHTLAASPPGKLRNGGFRAEPVR